MRSSERPDQNRLRVTCSHKAWRDNHPLSDYPITLLHRILRPEMLLVAAKLYVVRGRPARP